MVLLKGIVGLWEILEILAVVIVAVVGFGMMFVIFVRWNIPAVRRREMEEARMRRESKARTRRGKYGSRRYQ